MYSTEDDSCMKMLILSWVRREREPRGPWALLSAWCSPGTSRNFCPAGAWVDRASSVVPVMKYSSRALCLSVSPGHCPPLRSPVSLHSEVRIHVTLWNGNMWGKGKLIESLNEASLLQNEIDLKKKKKNSKKLACHLALNIFWTSCVSRIQDVLQTNLKFFRKHVTWCKDSHDCPF